MANFEAIKAAINAAIKRNGRQEITGEVMNGVLNGMVDSVNEKKQDTLVSGSNIKTINGDPILGAGDITVRGGVERLIIDWLVIDKRVVDDQGQRIYLSASSMESVLGLPLSQIFLNASSQDVILKSGSVSLFMQQSVVDADAPETPASFRFHPTTDLDWYLDIYSTPKVITINGEEFYYGAYLRGDSLFKTINGQSILGEGDITIEGYNDTEIREALAEVETALGNKQDKEAGKGLSTNDFTNADKALLEGVAKWGVVSQTQTWTQASDGGYDYVMSDLVRGWIPTHFIDLWVSRGGETATFNEESGYFEYLNLKDISYEEAKKIYSSSVDVFSYALFANSGGEYLQPRAIFPQVGGGGPNGNINCYSLFLRAGDIESVTFKGLMSEYTTTSQVNTLFYGDNKVKHIDGILRVSSATALGSDLFMNCFSLETISIQKIGKDISFANSPRLSTDSILYMINNEAATSAITITLHATAYARAMADTRITSALEIHTNITLAEA